MLLPQAMQTYAVAAISLITGVAAVVLAWRRRADMPAAIAIVIAGGILAAPHALPADLVLVSLALVAWGRAAWHDWLILSIGAVIAALAPAPVPALVGLVVIGWLLARLSGATTWPTPRPQPQAASSR